MSDAGAPGSESDMSPPLSIKSVIGGGFEDKAWSAAISSLQLKLREVEWDVGDAPFSLTVTYFIPGEVYGPKFSGIRVGTFLKEERNLVVQVALPEHPESDARAEIIALLGKVVDRAESWGKRKKLLSGPLLQIRNVVASL